MEYLTIKTARTNIIPYSHHYLEEIYEYRKDPNINCFYSIKTESSEELKDYINKHNKYFYEENSYTIFVIKSNVRNRIIGEIAVKSWENNTISAIGFAINPKEQNKGYAKECVKAFCDHLMLKENRVRIQADVDQRNKKSIKILEYVGMKKEEEFKKHEENSEDEIIEYMYGINRANST